MTIVNNTVSIIEISLGDYKNNCAAKISLWIHIYRKGSICNNVNATQMRGLLYILNSSNYDEEMNL